MWPFKRKEIWEVSKILRKDGSQMGTRLLRRHAKANRSEYPDLVYCTMTFDGELPRGSQWEVLSEVDDCLEQLESLLGFLVVGVMTMDGKRDSILYAKDGQNLMTELHQRLGDKGVQLECTADPAWSQYRDLAKL
ncbi:MAG: DUF695 domain-containing protein [Chlorobia bacterium]|nr:DUF695 domain-containing protein [Fimbriimonadaceae bacterium]